MSGDHDVYYLTAETYIGGELRGFSRQIRARTRHGECVPAIVQHIGAEFLADVLKGSDVHAYSSVLSGKRTDYPYRHAAYSLDRNGERIVTSFAIRPIRPETTQ